MSTSSLDKTLDVVTVSEPISKSSTFASGASDKLYEPIPEYEGRHRYDPKATWTQEEEKKLVRKVSTYQAYTQSSKCHC